MGKKTRIKNETESTKVKNTKKGTENTTEIEKKTETSNAKNTLSGNESITDIKSKTESTNLKDITGTENTTDIENKTENPEKKANDLSKEILKTKPVSQKKPVSEKKKTTSGRKKTVPVEEAIPVPKTSKPKKNVGRPKKKQSETSSMDPIAEPAEDGAMSAEPEGKSRSTGGRRGVGYEASEYVSVQAMSVLKGFTPLGMLFVLMDVLNGGEEGLIRVNRLANALSVGKPAMLAQLDNLENAGMIRTVSSSQRGRYIELLLPNLMASKLQTRQMALLNVLPKSAPKNFSLEKLKALHDYLTERGIRVVSLPDETGLDPRVTEISAFLGKYLSYVRPFYTRLKATLSLGEEVRFSLTGFQGRDVTHTLNFCKMLKDVGFLASFTYHRSPLCEVAARINRVPASINFLSGGWLEHYIRDRVTAVLATHPSTMEEPFAFMKNPQILLPGDEDFEFDFLLMVADTVFWIEAKTGEYMDYIGKYSRVSQLLGLSLNTNFLVLADAPKPDSNISARYGLSCCSVDEFPEVFRLALVRELGRTRRRRK
jgi:hypothetical protein